MQHPVRLQAEGIRDVPVSTATSVDSRAALLSSFWDTMSTDHAPEADDGSDVLAPAHASQCASGPSWDAPHHSVTVHPGRQSPPMAPTYNMSICCDNIKHTESETPGSLGKSPTVSSTPEVEHGHQHETRPSLQLRMASLSPTLAASPGDAICLLYSHDYTWMTAYNLAWLPSNVQCLAHRTSESPQILDHNPMPHTRCLHTHCLPQFCSNGPPTTQCTSMYLLFAAYTRSH